MITILVIDDHPLVVGGINTMLNTSEDISITGSATTAAEALDLLSEDEYDIILLDISLPDTDGITLCKKIRENNKQTKIIGLTSSNEAGIITQFLVSGGNGYLLKNMERSELLEAIYQVLEGKVFLSKAANEKILEQFTSLKQATDEIPVLTRREKEILLLLNEGLNGPQIAQQLFLSPHTIETHRKNMMQKFHSATTQELIKKAREMAMVN